MSDSRLASIDARVRLTPTLNSSPLFTLRHSPASGWGIYATQNLVQGAQLLSSSGVVADVIYRTYRKEVCTWCFRYDDGRHWKVHARRHKDGEGDQKLGVVVFCSDDCRDSWVKSVGELGVTAYGALEDFVYRRTRKTDWSRVGCDRAGANDVLSTIQVEDAWLRAEAQGFLIRSFRALDDTHGPQKSRGKQMKKALEAALTAEVNDTDALYFLLSGILLRPTSSWESLLMLNPSIDKVYPTIDALNNMTTAYLQLLAVLPAPLLQYTTRETLEAVTARDIGNSFGINDDFAEELGYGIWPEASFFNHSCAPNISRRRVDRQWVFEVYKDVPAGAELCISYIRGDELLPLVERKERLRSGWGFECVCSKCEEEAKLVDVK